MRPVAQAASAFHRHTVTEADVAAFADGLVHRVYGTAAMVRDMEYSARLVLLDLLEPGEEGVGAEGCCRHLALVLLSGTAAAGRLVDAAVDGLRDTPIYVSDAADPKPTKGQQDELRQHISGADVPIYVAILPEAALNEAGGNASGVAGAIAQSLKRPGVYAVIVGGHFAAGSTSGVMPKGTTPRLATQAVEAHRGKPDARQATLLDFVDRVKAAAAQGGTGGAAAKDSGSGSGVGTVLAIAVVVLLVVAEIGRAS